MPETFLPDAAIVVAAAAIYLTTVLSVERSKRGRRD